MLKKSSLGKHQLRHKNKERVQEKIKEKVKTGTINQEGKMRKIMRIPMTTAISMKISIMMIDMEEEEGAGVE